MRAILTRFRGQPWQRVLPGVQNAPVRAIDDLKEAEIYSRYFFGPSVNISGLRCGYTGPGTVTFSLPHLAEAFLDIRIPRTWKAGEVVSTLRTHLDHAGFSDIEVQVFGAFDGFRVDRRAGLVRAAQDLFDAAGVEVIWWPMTAGGGPWSIFTSEFGIPVLRDIGLGHGRASARDEYLVIEGTGSIGGMVEMAHSHAAFMMSMADSSSASPTTASGQ